MWNDWTSNVTTIKNLLIPHPLIDLRVAKEYIPCEYVKASQCIKLVANHDLKQIIPGSSLLVYKDDNELIQVQNQVMSDYNNLKEL